MRLLVNFSNSPAALAFQQNPFPRFEQIGQPEFTVAASCCHTNAS